MFKEVLNQKEIAELMKGAPAEGIVEVRMRDPKRTGSVTLRGYLLEENGSTVRRPFVDSKGNDRVVKYIKKKRLNMLKLLFKIEVRLRNQTKEKVQIKQPNLIKMVEQCIQIRFIWY